jgi:hypothetical protein
MSSQQQQLPPIGQSRQQQPRMSSPILFTSSSSVLSSKSSTISGAEGSSSCVGNTETNKNTTASNHNSSNIDDKLQKDITNRALSKKAQVENDAMVYLDGPQIYTCGQCRTHLTSHDDIISKSFHGRHGMLCFCLTGCYLVFVIFV